MLIPNLCDCDCSLLWSMAQCSAWEEEARGWCIFLGTKWSERPLLTSWTVLSTGLLSPSSMWSSKALVSLTSVAVWDTSSLFNSVKLISHVKIFWGYKKLFCCFPPAELLWSQSFFWADSYQPSAPHIFLCHHINHSFCCFLNIWTFPSHPPPARRHCYE